MSAHSIAKTAYRQALEAAEMEALYEEALRMDAERQKAKIHEETFALALPLLNEWFPGVEWDYTAEGDYGYDTIIMEKGSEWSDPLKIKAERRLVNRHNVQDGGYRIELSCVVHVNDTSMPGYSYWTGPIVKSVADVGRFLANKKKTNDNSC